MDINSKLNFFKLWIFNETLNRKVMPRIKNGIDIFHIHEYRFIPNKCVLTVNQICHSS